MFHKTFFYTMAALFFLIPAAAGFTGAPAADRSSAPGPEQEQIRAFIYHHFGMEDQYPSTSVSVDQFKDHLDYLDTHDYTVLTLGQALDRLYSEKGVFQKTAVISIDDGYGSVWENAMPLLEKYGYPATIFIATAYVGGDNYLSWDQIQQLQKKGFEIGNHSHGHAYFLNKPKEEIADAFEADLKKSHAQFRRHLGHVPELYAYPAGEYCPEMADVLKKYDYRAGAAQKSGVIHRSGDRFALPRFPMNVNYAEMESFEEKIGMNALEVTKAEPESPLVTRKNNPPALKLHIRKNKINPDGLQCFVSGEKSCKMEISEKNKELVVEVRGDDTLTSRRTLYTLTAPSKDGSGWFWYSHSWVIPEEKPAQK